MNQWRFYVVPRATLEKRTRSQHSITLKSLEELCAGGDARCSRCDGLRECVEKAAELTRLHE